jgi:hypothetical protein
MPWLFTLGNHNKLICVQDVQKDDGTSFMVAICHRGSTINRLAFWFEEDQAASKAFRPSTGKNIQILLYTHSVSYAEHANKNGMQDGLSAWCLSSFPYTRNTHASVSMIDYILLYVVQLNYNQYIFPSINHMRAYMHACSPSLSRVVAAGPWGSKTGNHHKVRVVRTCMSNVASKFD